jgi:hypothetical protein
VRASWPQRGAAAHGRSTRTASSGWHCRAGPDGTSEGAHRGARSRETAHQLRRQGGTLAELAPVLASVPTVNASPQRWRYGFANEWRSCGLGIRPACPGRGAVRRPSCSHAPVTSRSPRHRALIRLRWPAVACPLGCLVCAGPGGDVCHHTGIRRPRPRDGGCAGSCSRRKNRRTSSTYRAGALYRPEVPATVEVGPVSAGQRMDVHDMVDEIGCLISRSLCWGTVTPGSRSGRPPSSGAVRGRQMNSVRRSRVLEMDVRARGCRPTGCGSLIRGGALCEFRRRV